MRHAMGLAGSPYFTALSSRFSTTRKTASRSQQTSASPSHVARPASTASLAETTSATSASSRKKEGWNVSGCPLPTTRLSRSERKRRSSRWWLRCMRATAASALGSDTSRSSSWPVSVAACRGLRRSCVTAAATICRISLRSRSAAARASSARSIAIASDQSVMPSSAISAQASSRTAVTASNSPRSWAASTTTVSTSAAVAPASSRRRPMRPAALREVSAAETPVCAKDRSWPMDSAMNATTVGMATPVPGSKAYRSAEGKTCPSPSRAASSSTANARTCPAARRPDASSMELPPERARATPVKVEDHHASGNHERSGTCTACAATIAIPNITSTHASRSASARRAGSATTPAAASSSMSAVIGDSAGRPRSSVVRMGASAIQPTNDRLARTAAATAKSAWGVRWGLGDIWRGGVGASWAQRRAGSRRACRQWV